MDFGIKLLFLKVGKTHHHEAAAAAAAEEQS
jgi:hypothetical protein